MNQRVTVILLIALVISAGVTYLVYQAVVSRSQASTVASTQIIVAARDLETGTLIKDADLKTGTWAGVPPKGMAVKTDGLSGRGVIATIYAGEPILESRLAPAGAGAGLAATIPTGMRACAVKVNEIVGVAGFVVPGMRVDVLISGKVPGNRTTDDIKVKTLLQNIEVLSAGQNYQKDAEGKPIVVPVVNLLVNPEQAEVLSLASNETRIQLVLRNPLDREVAKTKGSAVTALFGESKPEPKPAAQARPRMNLIAAKKAAAEVKPAVVVLPPYQIDVINGPKRSEVKFERRQEERQ